MTKTEGMDIKTLQNKFFFGVVLLLFTVGSVNAQEEKKGWKDIPTYQTINASYIYGIQIYNDNVLYNPGYSLQFSIGKSIHKDVSVGLGSGYFALKDEHFVPIFMEVIGNKKKKENTPFIRIQAGYSIAWNGASSNNEYYDLSGGLYFNAGMGRKIKINDSYALMLHWSLCHQFADMEYSAFGKKYSDTLNYDMIQISVGLLMN